MTRRARTLVLAAGLLVAAPAWAQGPPPPPLRLCLEQGPPPLSSPAGGADAQIAQAVADRLGQPLERVWYDLEDDDDASTSAQVNALLAAGMCQLVGGVALTQDALRPPPVKTFRMQLPDRSRRSVVLGTLIHSQPYRAVGYVVALAAGGKSVTGLGDLRGCRIVVEQGSLTGYLLLGYQGGVLRPDIHQINPRTQNLFALLAAGKADAALVERQRFDVYQADHPQTALRDSGYRPGLQLNLGFVALESEAPLIGRVDAAIEHLTQSGELAAITQRQGLSYQAPSEPVLLPPLSNRLLAAP